jgi:hypothetical protein
VIKAKSVGGLAWQALEARWKAEVMGVTSGGVFLRVNQERILFLTYSPFHSPLTINLEWDGKVDLQEVQVGAQAFLDPYRITIPGSQLGIWLQGASLWQPAFPALNGPIDLEAARARLKRIGLAAAQEKGDQGFGPLIPYFVAAEGSRAAGDLTEEMITSLKKAQESACRRDFQGVIDHARSWIGYGRGLTPAGDDCLAGVLLVLNRWGARLGLELHLDGLNAAVISLAKERTTLLSCTILQAAALGQADERILRILDGIMFGEENEAEAIRNLVRMGHSSGVDTLTGIALVITGLPAC